MPHLKRKGARSLKDIPASIVQQLNRGEIESVNLMEWLAVDQIALLKYFLQQADRAEYFEPIAARIQLLHKPTLNSINCSIGLGLCQQAMLHDDGKWLLSLWQQPSDSVRGWLCYSVALHPDWSLREKFDHIKIGAQDLHFGVREIAWMAIRSLIIDALEPSLEILQAWTMDANPYIRRFASEATRPRGVWCAHIKQLKQQPEYAEKLLHALAQDTDKYVRDSVGNWLNDASKTRPDFVKALCQNWQSYQNPHTEYIVKRGLRTLKQ